MKIGIIAHLKHPVSAPFAGGLEAFTHHITKALIARGHEVILFASSSSDPSLPIEPILSDGTYDKKSGLRIKRKDLPSEYIAEHHAYFGLMVNIDNYGLDVIFNNSLHYIPITMADTVKTPMVTVLHTPPFYELEMAINAAKPSHKVKFATVSKNNALNWEKAVDEIAVINNGIPLSDWTFYPQNDAEPYAIWFGRIHPDKGLHLAIEAARKAGIKLRIAGGIADQRYYHNEISPILGEDTILLGLLDHKALNKEIGNAAVCIITPCWQEPFGLVVAEAMACGTPVAGFIMGALPDLVTAETGVLTKFGDTDALGHAIIEAAGLDRIAVRDYAHDQFNDAHMVNAYEELLESTSLKKNTLKYVI